MPLTFILRAATVHYLFAVTQHSMLTITAIIRVNRHVLATSMELRLDQIAYMIIAAHLIHFKVVLEQKIN